MMQRGREVAAAAHSNAAGDAAAAAPLAEPAAAGAGEAEGSGLLGRLGQRLAPGQGVGVCVHALLATCMHRTCRTDLCCDRRLSIDGSSK